MNLLARLLAFLRNLFRKQTMDTPHEVKDAQGNVVDEILLDPTKGPFTIVEKQSGGSGGGGSGPRQNQ